MLFVWERPKINDKRGRGWPIKKEDRIQVNSVSTKIRLFSCIEPFTKCCVNKEAIKVVCFLSHEFCACVPSSETKINCQMSLKVAQSLSLSSSLPLFIYFSLSYIVPILSTCLSRSPVRSFILFLFITFFCSASHPTFSHRPICSLSLFPLSPSLSIYSQFEQPLLHVQEPMLGIIIAHVRDVPVHLVTTVPNL